MDGAHYCVYSFTHALDAVSRGVVEVEVEVEVSITLGASACSRFPTPLPMQRIARGRVATRAICTERLMLIRWRVRPFRRCSRGGGSF